jgi:hypothetical protein
MTGESTPARILRLSSALHHNHSCNPFSYQYPEFHLSVIKQERICIPLKATMADHIATNADSTEGLDLLDHWHIVDIFAIG